jgi:hypothetical protein
MGCPLWREVGPVDFRFWWASPEQPFSGLSPTGLMSIFYCLCFLDSSNLEDQVPVFTSTKFKFKLHCDRRSIDQSSLSWCRSSIRGPHVVGHLPWREGGSVIGLYNPLSLSGPSPAELMTTSHCLTETPPVWRARCPYLNPPKVKV